MRALARPEDSFSIIGRVKAAVLPVPVWAIPRISWPARATGMACSWIGGMTITGVDGAAAWVGGLGAGAGATSAGVAALDVAGAVRGAVDSAVLGAGAGRAGAASAAGVSPA